MKSITKLALVLAVLALTAGSCFAAVSGVADLKNAKVGVESGSTAEALMRETVSKDNIFTYEHVGAVIDALRDKKIDAAVVDETPARYIVMNDENIIMLPEAVESLFCGIAFKKGNKLRDDVNKILDEFKQDGTLAEIIARNINLGPDPEIIDLNKNAKNGKLWVGCSATFPPYEIRTERGFAGIDVELCAEIAKKLDKELVMVDYRFDILPEALESGRIDMICSAYTISGERQKTMDFTEPYDADQEVILVLAESEAVTSPDKTNK